MKLENLELTFVEPERRVSMHKVFPWVSLYADIFVLWEKFIEYQKDLFVWALADISDKLSSDEEINSNDFKKFFEQLLQDLNSKLMVFAEKIKDVERFPIKWAIHIFFENFYMASFIGDVSIVVLRDNKINLSLDNSYNDEDQKIDIFSDLIEWELESEDKILFAATNIMSILDKDDIMWSIQLSVSEDRPLIEIIRDICSTRIELSEIVMLSYFNFEYEIVINRPNIQDKLKKNLAILNVVKNSIIKFRFPLIIALWVLLIFFLFYFIIVKNINSANVGNFNWDTVVIDFTIEDLKRDLDLFKKLDPTSDEKSIKYNELMKKLTILEQKNKWPYDVKEIKTILNWEYYKWFNIALMDNLDQYQIYKFDDTEKQSMWQINTLFYNNWLMIWWSKWALIWAINEKVRGKAVNFNLPIEINDCTNNILKDGLYCYSNDWNIVNVTKGWLQTVATKSWKFPWVLSDVWAYGKSSFYVFPVNYGSWVFNVRYNNIVWSQTNFSEWVNYFLDWETSQKYADVLNGGFSSVFVDWTFLGWSKAKKDIYQFWRDNKSWSIYGRNVGLMGWKMFWSGYSDNVKIMAFKDYVYLFDRNNNTFTVYSTAPSRTNTSYTTNYKMIYFFRLDFSLLNYKVLDVYVEEAEKRSMYLTTTEWVYKIKLYEFEESFRKKK